MVQALPGTLPELCGSQPPACLLSCGAGRAATLPARRRRRHGLVPRAGCAAGGRRAFLDLPPLAQGALHGAPEIQGLGWLWYMQWDLTSLTPVHCLVPQLPALPLRPAGQLPRRLPLGAHHAAPAPRVAAGPQRCSGAAARTGLCARHCKGEQGGVSSVWVQALRFSTDLACEVKVRVRCSPDLPALLPAPACRPPRWRSPHRCRACTALAMRRRTSLEMFRTPWGGAPGRRSWACWRSTPACCCRDRWVGDVGT